MPREKIKFAMRIKPETQELVREWYSKDNCQSQNEFIEKAIHFYGEHLSAQSSTSFLPSALVSALRATIQASKNRIARLLFKLTVEISMPTRPHHGCAGSMKPMIRSTASAVISAGAFSSNTALRLPRSSIRAWSHITTPVIFVRSSNRT